MGRLTYWLFGAYFVLGPFFFPNAPIIESLPTLVSVSIGYLGWRLLKWLVFLFTYMGASWKVQRLMYASAFWLSAYEIYERLDRKCDLVVIARVLVSLEKVGIASRRERKEARERAGPWGELDIFHEIEWKITHGGPRRRVILKPAKLSVLPGGVMPA